MVGIVAVTKFCEASSNTFSSYIDYIDRSNAVRKDNHEKYNVFSEYTDYMDDETKTVVSGEAKLEKMSALFTKDKDALTKSEKKKLKDAFKKAQDNGSNMWQTVISFDNQYLSDLGVYDIGSGTLNEKQLRQAARRAVGDMLKSEGLENATWAASFHYNTDNIHIHIATVEPIPMREKRKYALYEKNSEGEYPKDKYGKIIKRPVYDNNGNQVFYEAYKGTFKKKSIDALKSGIRNELEGSRDVHKEITRLLRENILADKKQKNLLDTPEFTDKMLELYQELKKSGVPRKNWNYNMNLISHLRPKIDDLSGFFIEAYHQDDFNAFVAQIGSEAARQASAYGGSDNNYIKNMLYGKEGLYARLGNAILREIRSYDKNIQAQRQEANKASNLLNPESDDYNPEEAIKLLQEQSDRGNTYAQNRLGLIYLQGIYVKKDPEKAQEYFKKSADRGNSFGSTMLNELRNGTGTFASLNPGYHSASYPRRDIRLGLKALERNLKNQYAHRRNLQEAEELQREIDMRGEER